MNKFTQLLPFVQDMFDDQAVARKATEIIEGILKARSPRLSEIARIMYGRENANYKRIQRFLEVIDPRQVLLRLFHKEAPFVIGDPTEMPPSRGTGSSRPGPCGWLRVQGRPPAR